jgi:hypothetical protein
VQQPDETPLESKEELYRQAAEAAAPTPESAATNRFSAQAASFAQLISPAYAKAVRSLPSRIAQAIKQLNSLRRKASTP